MNTPDILTWIKKNLSPFMLPVLDDQISEAMLAGLTCREVDGLIAKFVPRGWSVAEICANMRGDLDQRRGETSATFHGYGITQIDIASYPDFVSSGDWKDPAKCYAKTAGILRANRAAILRHISGLEAVSLERYMLAAYNCGVGNEFKVIDRHLDFDAYTTGHDYSFEIWEHIQMYNQLFPPEAIG